MLQKGHSRVSDEEESRRGNRCITLRFSYHEPFTLDEFSIEAFPTSHDAREPCGYLVTAGDARLGFCTDTGIVTDRMMTYLKRSDAIVLESNHCPEMLRTGPYPEMLKRRIRSKNGHLSNTDAAELYHGTWPGHNAYPACPFKRGE